MPFQPKALPSHPPLHGHTVPSTALSPSTLPSHGSGLSCYSIPYAEQGTGLHPVPLHHARSKLWVSFLPISSAVFFLISFLVSSSLWISLDGNHVTRNASAGSTGMSVSMHHPAGVMTPGPPELGSSLFYITFIAGNISVCAGCHARYVKPAVPPHDLCLRHQEWREFTLPINPAVQRRFGNTYYHPCFTCIRSRWPYTQPKDIGK